MSMYSVGPWARPRAQQPLTQSRASEILNIFAGVVWLSVFAGALLLARHNVRANRADRRGAARLAALYLAVEIVGWIFGAHHLSGLAEVNSFFRAFGNILFEAGILWALYLALEPYGRRFWPDGLLGWTRLFSGRVRDPRIGREILIGCALGGVLITADLFRGARAIRHWTAAWHSQPRLESRRVGRRGSPGARAGRIRSTAACKRR